jgi:acetylcholinesterase
MGTVTHGQEVNYVFGDCASKPLASQLLCQNMINYWLSFATSLTPNDGKGSARVNWPAYTASSPVCTSRFLPTSPLNSSQAIIQLNGTNTTAIPDDYRKEQISYINNNTIVFHQRRSDGK